MRTANPLDEHIRGNWFIVAYHHDQEENFLAGDLEHSFISKIVPRLVVKSDKMRYHMMVVRHIRRGLSGEFTTARASEAAHCGLNWAIEWIVNGRRRNSYGKNKNR